MTTVRDAVIDPHGRLHTLCHPVAARWFLTEAALAARLSLRWFRDALGGAEVAEARRFGRDPYVLLTAEPERVEPGSAELVFLSYLVGERTPHGPTGPGMLCGPQPDPEEGSPGPGEYGKCPVLFPGLDLDLPRARDAGRNRALRRRRGSEPAV